MVLSRRRGEQIVVAAGTPYETVITLLELRYDQARLGFTADPAVTVHRAEIQARVDRQALRDDIDAAMDGPLTYDPDAREDGRC